MRNLLAIKGAGFSIEAAISVCRLNQFVHIFLFCVGRKDRFTFFASLLFPVVHHFGTNGFETIHQRSAGLDDFDYRSF